MERYKKVFSAQKNLYVPKAPLIIEAGALLFDNTMQKALVQLKFRNITARVIRDITVRIHAFSREEELLQADLLFTYTDLNLGEQQSGGSQTPISLEDPASAVFTVEVVEVVFTDTTVWRETGAIWGPLPQPQALENYLESSELAELYRQRFGEQCRYRPMMTRDLWFCTCGAICRKGTRCPVCKNDYDHLTALDPQTLKEEQKARSEQKKRILRYRKYLIPAAAVLALFLIIFGFFHFKKQRVLNSEGFKDFSSYIDDHFESRDRGATVRYNAVRNAVIVELRYEEGCGPTEENKDIYDKIELHELDDQLYAVYDELDYYFSETGNPPYLIYKVYSYEGDILLDREIG